MEAHTSTQVEVTGPPSLAAMLVELRSTADREVLAKPMTYSARWVDGPCGPPLRKDRPQRLVLAGVKIDGSSGQDWMWLVVAGNISQRMEHMSMALVYYKWDRAWARRIVPSALRVEADSATGITDSVVISEDAGPRAVVSRLADCQGTISSMVRDYLEAV